MKENYLNNNKLSDIGSTGYQNKYADVTVTVMSDDEMTEEQIFLGRLFMGHPSKLLFNPNPITRDWAKTIDNGFTNLFRPSNETQFQTAGDIAHPWMNNFYFFKEITEFDYGAGSHTEHKKINGNLPIFRNEYIECFDYILNERFDAEVDSYAFSLINASKSMIPHIPYMMSDNQMVCMQYYMTNGFIDEMKNQKSYAIKNPETLETIKYTFSENPDRGLGVRYTCVSLSEFKTWFDKSFGFEQPATPTKPKESLSQTVLLSFNINAAKVKKWFGYGDHLIVDYGEDIKEWYINWQNDFNIWQCQPIYGKAVMNENYDRLTTLDSNDNEHIQYIDVLPQFNLYTGYLSDAQYKEWQSVFRSRYIYLFNTKLNRGWWVKTTNNTSILKTYNNDGMKFININLSAINKSQL